MLLPLRRGRRLRDGRLRLHVHVNGKLAKSGKKLFPTPIDLLISLHAGAVLTRDADFCVLYGRGAGRGRSGQEGPRFLVDSGFLVEPD